MATDGPAHAQPRGWSVYATPLMAALAALGFSSGVPNLFASSIVRTWTTKEGWSVEAVGALSLLTLPYALKFLWAPLVDRVPFPGMARLGRLRSWMLAMHAAAIACMLAACVTGPGGEGAQAFIALTALAVLASATPPEWPPPRERLSAQASQAFLRMAATASAISSRCFLPRLWVPSLRFASFRARFCVEAEPIFKSSSLRRS